MIQQCTNHSIKNARWSDECARLATICEEQSVRSHSTLGHQDGRVDGGCIVSIDQFLPVTVAPPRCSPRQGLSVGSAAKHGSAYGSWRRLT
jgi:hypothetical protein